MLTTEQRRIIKKDVNKTIDLVQKEETGVNFFKTIMGDNFFADDEKYTGIYSNATEDIRGYNEEFNKPTVALTITGSGDQIINMANIGAKEIDAFDINPLSKRGSALRIAAVRTLDQSVFHYFYKTFASNIFAKVSENLSEEDYAYWNAIYDIMDPKIIRTNLFPYLKLEKEDSKAINPYLDEENYKQVQRLLSEVKINYIDCDIYDLPQHIKDKRYDAMNFSNIYEYLNFGKETSIENAKRYRDFIMKEMYSRLNEGGTIVASYMYAFSEKVKEEIDKMIIRGESPILSGAISFEEMEKYMNGFTGQNLSYSMLLDEFKNDPIKMIQTAHVYFGQSMDKSHDLALCLKK